MSVKELPMFTLLCDKCGRDANEGTEYAGWGDVSSAVDVAEDSGWTTLKNGEHYCPDCPRCERCEGDAGDLCGERDYLCPTCYAAPTPTTTDAEGS